MTNAMLVNKNDFGRLADLVKSACLGRGDSFHLQGLKEGLDRSRVVPPKRVPREVVTMRSRVEIRDLDTDEVDTYTLAYPDEADLDQGMISVLSPLGSAIFGARVGEVVHRRVPRGFLRVRVEKILYQPEAAGDHDA